MAIGNAAGYTTINGGSYIPQLYAPKLLTKWYKSTIFDQVMNTQYEGQLKKFGSKVIIRKRPTITGSAYTRGLTWTYTYKSTTSIELEIDTAYYWQFAVDDIDEAQVDLNFINDWIDEAVQQQKIYTETLIFNAAPASVPTANKGATAGAISGAYNMGTIAAPVHITNKETYDNADTGIEWVNAADLCADMISVLDENNAPDSIEKFIIGPSILSNRVAKSALRDASVTGDTVGLIRGGPSYVGKVNGGQVYKCNNLTAIDGGTNGTTTVFPVLFGVMDAWTFAGQIEKIERESIFGGFGMGHKGLWVFGWAIHIEEGLGVAYITVAQDDD